MLRAETPVSGAECVSRLELAARQWERLHALLRHAWDCSPFYRARWQAMGLAGPDAIRGMADLPLLGFTTRAEIACDQAAHPPWGSLTAVPERFVAVHHTSGETGPPLLWFDDGPSWRWVRGLWDYAFRAAGVGPGDRAFFAFAFAPVLWYWAGFERAQELGALALTGGAMTPQQQMENLFALEATVLVAPAAALLDLARVAVQHGLHPARSKLRAVLYAARPGSDPAVTGRELEAAWGADAFCITWLTEAGLTGFECPARPGGVHLLESELLCEVIDPATGRPAPPGAPGELVVTPLGRTAMPVVRYRTGDLVVLDESPCPCGRTFRRLAGGIRGRAGPAGGGEVASP